MLNEKETEEYMTEKTFDEELKSMEQVIGTKDSLIEIKPINIMIKDCVKERKLSISHVPTAALVLIILFGALAIFMLIIGKEYEIELYSIYGIVLFLLVMGAVVSIIIFGHKVVEAPYQAVVMCGGRLYTVWGPGLHFSIIPFLMRIKQCLPINTNIPMDIFIDEANPITLKDDAITHLKIQIIIKIKNILDLVFNLTILPEYIKKRKKDGVLFDFDFQFGIEEIADAVVRGKLSGRSLEDILSVRPQVFAQAVESEYVIKSSIEKMIERALDAELRSVGIDVISVNFSEIVTSKETQEIRRTVQKAKTQIEVQKQATLQEAEGVKTEEEIKKRRETIGKGKGSEEKEILKAMIESGILPGDAAKIRIAQITADAISKSQSPVVFFGDMSGSAAGGASFGAGANKMLANKTKKEKKEE